jgi:hypothetical protein
LNIDVKADSDAINKRFQNLTPEASQTLRTGNGAFGGVTAGSLRNSIDKKITNFGSSGSIG